MNPALIPLLITGLTTLFSAMRNQGYKRRWLKFAEGAVAEVQTNLPALTGPAKREAAKAMLIEKIGQYEFLKRGTISATPEESILNLVIEMAVTKMKAKESK
jgi:hypothetical protein